MGSDPRDLLDQAARHGVEEKGEEEKQPVMHVSHEVVGRLERVQEPDEACIGLVRAATGAEGALRKDMEDEGRGVARAPGQNESGSQLRTQFQVRPVPSHQGCLGPQSPPLQLFAFVKNCVLNHSVMSHSVTLRTVARQAPLSMGILQARILEWIATPSSGDLPNPGIEPRSPTLWADSLPSEPPGKPKNTGVGSLSLV